MAMQSHASQANLAIPVTSTGIMSRGETRVGLILINNGAADITVSTAPVAVAGSGILLRPNTSDSHTAIFNEADHGAIVMGPLTAIAGVGGSTLTIIELF